MRFLITGAAGFIGSHLTDRLLADPAHHDVWAVDNLLTGRRDNVHPHAAFHECDITNRNHFYEVANDCKPDVIIHCAASYSDPNLWHRDTDTNVAGTINATLAAKHHGARLVYFQTALPPISSYAISKIVGEQYIALSNVPSLVFRLANIYGPRNLSGPIPTFYKRLTAGQPCTVVDTRRDMVYIYDLIDGVKTGIDSGATGKFDMCSGRDSSIADIYETVELYQGLATGRSVRDRPRDAEHVPAPADDVASMTLNPRPAHHVLGWTPTTKLAVGVRSAVEWYQEHSFEHTYTHLTLKG